MNLIKRENSSPIFNSKRGFTLIEMMVAIGIMAILGSFGIAGFSNYNQAQVLKTSADGVATMLNLAKSRAQSQIKPSDKCLSAASMIGYSVKITESSYGLFINCSDGSEQQIDEQQKTLPSGLKFHSISAHPFPVTFFFPVQKGGMGDVGSSDSIVICNSAEDKAMTLAVNPLGIVNVKSSACDYAPLPTSTPTSTPVPMPGWTIAQNGITIVNNYEPVKTANSAETFYSYGNPSPRCFYGGIDYNGEIDAEEDESMFFLHEDTSTDIVSLVIVNGKYSGSGHGLKATVSGVDNVIVKDDPEDNFTASGGITTCSWAWGPLCTDGAVFGAVSQNAGECISIQFSENGILVSPSRLSFVDKNEVYTYLADLFQPITICKN